MRQLQQSLIVKQDDITRLNQDGARLVADLSHAHKALYDQQSSHRQLEQKIEALRTVEQHGKTSARASDPWVSTRQAAFRSRSGSGLHRSSRRAYASRISFAN